MVTNTAAAWTTGRARSTGANVPGVTGTTAPGRHADARPEPLRERGRRAHETLAARSSSWRPLNSDEMVHHLDSEPDD